MELTTDQLAALDLGDGVPVTVGDRDCVIISSSTYKQIQRLVDEWHPSTMQRQLADMMRDDWSDPAMDVYDG